MLSFPARDILLLMDMERHEFFWVFEIAEMMEALSLIRGNGSMG